MKKPTSDPMGAAPYELRTPGAVSKLDDDVRADLAHIRSLVVGAASLLEGLEDSVRLLPALASRIRGWRNQTDELVRQLEEESEDVTRKILGNDAATITESVDTDHAERVRLLRTGTES